MHNKIFYCYSANLKNFLLLNGERYVCSDIHKKTNRRYWCFIGDDKLNNLINEFKLNKVKLKRA